MTIVSAGGLGRDTKLEDEFELTCRLIYEEYLNIYEIFIYF